MQVFGVVLLLISVGLIVAPVSAVVVMYRNNLPELVIPPQIQNAMNGNESFIMNDQVSSISSEDLNDPTAILNNFVMPNFVGAQVDKTSDTFSVEVNVTNPLKYDLTLNELSTDIQSTDGQTLASVDISHPIILISGQSTLVQVEGDWTQAGNSFITQHWYDSSITVSLANMNVNVNGISVTRTTPLTVSLPITLSTILVG